MSSFLADGIAQAFGQKKVNGKYVSVKKPTTAASTTPAAVVIDPMVTWNGKQYKQSVVDTMKGQGLNPDGTPARPDREGYTDAEGNLLDKYTMELEQLDPSSLEGYNLIKELATQQGPSQYAQTATELANLAKQDTMDAGVRQAASSQAAAQAALAMRGGASSGSRERLAYNMQNNLLGTRQDASRENTKDLLNISLEDEKMKRDALTQFATAEGNIANSNLGLRNQATEYNMGNLLKDRDASNQWNMDVYTQQNAKWAAEKQAEATRKAGKSGGGGCFITTAVCEYMGLEDDNEFLNAFRKFRDEHMGGKKSKELTEYYSVAPKIVSYVNALPEKDKVWRYVVYHYLVPAYFCILRKDYEGAQEIYQDLVTSLRYLAEV